MDTLTYGSIMALDGFLAEPSEHVDDGVGTFMNEEVVRTYGTEH